MSLTPINWNKIEKLIPPPRLQRGGSGSEFATQNSLSFQSIRLLPALKTQNKKTPRCKRGAGTSDILKFRISRSSQIRNTESALLVPGFLPESGSFRGLKPEFVAMPMHFRSKCARLQAFWWLRRGNEVSTGWPENFRNSKPN